MTELLPSISVRIFAAATLAFALCSARGAIFTVTNVNDSGPGSLRSALVSANNTPPGPNTILFDLSGTGPFTIAPLSSLPALTAPVTIDGWSQPGWTNLPLVQLNGGSVPGAYGLVLNTSNSLVRGLAIYGFQAGSVVINGLGSDGNTLQGNFFGTDANGLNGNKSTNGVVITNGASSNLIGTDWNGVNDAAEANSIANNTACGVSITSSNCIQNRIWGNSIVGNGDRGIQLGTGPTVTNGPAPGPNDFQNYPTIRGVYNNDSGPLILASLQSAPNQTFHLEFFSSGANVGSGQVFLGLTNVTTDATGAATVLFSFATWPSIHFYFTATATDADGNTSEFSPSFLGFPPVEPSITNVTPSHGNTAGGFLLTIQGSQFFAPVTVLLGGNQCPVLDVSNTVLQCYAPAGAGAHQAIVVIDNGQVSNPFYFDYDFPVILNMNPSYGSHAGGTLVTLTGSNFGTAAQVECPFLVSALTNTQTMIQFVTPPSTATNVPVTVSLDGQTSPRVLFNYVPDGPATLGLANNGGLLTLQINQLTLYSENFIQTSTDLFNWIPYTNFIAGANSTNWTLPTSSASQAFFRVLSQ